jgi:hypothetical protein
MQDVPAAENTPPEKLADLDKEASLAIRRLVEAIGSNLDSSVAAIERIESRPVIEKR